MLLHSLSMGREVDVWTLRSGVVHRIFERALVLDTGFTSGADACVGLAAACRFALVKAERLTA